jgi:predicted porin
MKKTIIAAAVAAAVAAPAAFADVSISGMVNPEFINSDTTDEDSYGAVNTDLVFTGSEDLGNGMKASFKYHLFNDGNATDATGAGNGVADTTVTLSGDFGAITAGRMESFHESKVQGFLNIDPSHDLDLENTLDNAAAGDRGNAVVAYTSPSMNGFQISVATGMINDANNASGAAATSGDWNDATDVMVSYSANGLTVFAERMDLDYHTTDDSFEAIGGSYKIGDLELRAMRRTTDVSNTEVDTDFLGVKYTMGAITLSAGTIDNDTNGDASIFGAAYSLSKRTSVYAVVNNSDKDSTTDASNTAGSGIGIKHTF